MDCPSCGSSNDAGRKFCAACGTRLVVACASCGTVNPPSARFCGECGAGLPVTAVPASEGRDARVAAASGNDASRGTSGAVAESRGTGAERRLVSVLFADLVGFTAVADDRDPEAVRELLTRYFDICREVIGRYGGSVEKFIGDAVMAVWGAPVAREDDAERAVRAALDLVDVVRGLRLGDAGPVIQARAGVQTGEAAVTLGAVGQGMVAGDLVNTASRLQSVAPPGRCAGGRGHLPGHRRRHRLCARRGAAAQGQGDAGAGMARPAHRRQDLRRRPLGGP